MLQTEFTSNSAENGVIANTDMQSDIVKKLEELNRWQIEQKKLLKAKQLLQRQMLGMEQKTMYQMLGLEIESDMNIVEVPRSQKVENLVSGTLDEYEQCIGNNFDNCQEVEVEKNTKSTEAASYKTLTSGYDTEISPVMQQTKPKKAFLKRGEGLKQRFKIHPDELRLNNLPKYKYANAHPKFRVKPKTKSSNKNLVKNVNAIVTKSADCLMLDVQEQRFQNLLIASQNTCNSTPDAKSSFASTKDKSTAVQKRFEGLPDKLNGIKAIEAPNAHLHDTPKVAWSKILDPLEIQPLQIHRHSLQTLPQTEESIFELLEKKAEDGSFDMDSTCLKEFMSWEIVHKLNETDDNIPVRDYLKNKRIEPVVLPAKVMQESSCYSSDEIGEEQSRPTQEVGSIESDDTTHKTLENTSSPYARKTQVRVRFSDSNDTHEYDDELESTLNDTSQNPTPNEGNKQFFAQFKEALFAALQIKADEYVSDSTLNSATDTTLISKESIPISDNSKENSIDYTNCKDLQEKTDLIKERLVELENEIKNFKDSNAMLLKAKQDHELQKALNAQEHLEAMESIKDEKIKLEIYLHDERVKLEDEKKLFEHNTKLKTQGVIAKERKECERLKHQVTELEIQLKNKDTNHTAAQGRLRTQIRNLEREQSKLHEQIENLRRENKRLESENLKISREQNNKILLEINRNIAKLAPKQVQNSSYPIPEEGPPVLGIAKTASKSLGAAADTKKFVSKTQRSIGIKFSQLQPLTNKKSSEQNYDEMEINSDANSIKIQDEDDEDILGEFQLTPETILNNPTITEINVQNKSTDKTEKMVTGASPSSERPSTGYLKKLKREIVNADGSKDIWYPNGNLKKISADGMIIRMLYFNKDIKETNVNQGTVKYYYAETNTWHTTYLDGLEILEFPNGQVEHRHKSGVVEVHYPNNSIKIMDPKDENKQEEWRFQDGTHLVQMRNGDKVLSLPNGQKEIHNKLHKRREYPDGTVKIVYPDGSTETRYSNGRVRLKDKEGKLVMDTDMSK